MRWLNLRISRLLVVIVCALCVTYLTACGGSGDPTNYASSAKGHVDGYLSGDDDSDGDTTNNNFDDKSVRDYGHSAINAEKQAITTIVEKYYSAVAAGDGAGACSLFRSR